MRALAFQSLRGPNGERKELAFISVRPKGATPPVVQHISIGKQRFIDAEKQGHHAGQWLQVDSSRTDPRTHEATIQAFGLNKTNHAVRGLETARRELTWTTTKTSPVRTTVRSLIAKRAIDNAGNHRVDVQLGTAQASSTSAPSYKQPINYSRLKPGRITPSEEAAHIYDVGYWKGVQHELSALMATKPSDVPTRLKLMQSLSQKMNVPYRSQEELGLDLQPRGPYLGDCAYSAFNSMIAFSQGRAVAPLTYPNQPGDVTNHEIKQSLSSLGVLTSVHENVGIGQAEALLKSKLADGQMAELVSTSASMGHATVVVKLGDTLYNVNNQGWVAASQPGQVQTLRQWDQTFAAATQQQGGDPASVRYTMFITPLKVAQPTDLHLR